MATEWMEMDWMATEWMATEWMEMEWMATKWTKVHIKEKEPKIESHQKIKIKNQ